MVKCIHSTASVRSKLRNRSHYGDILPRAVNQPTCHISQKRERQKERERERERGERERLNELGRQA